MTPVSHVLSGYLVGEFQIRGAQESGRQQTPDKKDRWRIVAAAVIGSIIPDVDVSLGLVGGWTGSGLHRGATHSLLLAPLLAGLIAWLVARVMGSPPRRPKRPLYFAALSGILTHIFWDWLNPWGAVLLWPWVRSFRGNLLHEGDRYAAAMLLAASLLVWRGRRVAAAVLLLELLPACLIVQLWWRDHAQDLAKTQLAGRRTAVYPASDLTCGWIILSAGTDDMAVHCVSSPIARSASMVFHVPLRNDPFIEASQQSAAVRDLRQKIPFSFAEVKPAQPAEGGGAMVLWRDLRIAYRELPEPKPTGLQLRIDASGNVISEEYRWWLSVW